MSHLYSNAVWYGSQAEGSAYVLMLRLADQTNDRTGCCWPTVAHLAAMCHVSESRAHALIAVLRKSGELEVVTNGAPRKTSSGQHASLYRINFVKLRVTALSNPLLPRTVAKGLLNSGAKGYRIHDKRVAAGSNQNR